MIINLNMDVTLLPRYIINVKQFAKFVVDLADSVAPTDIEEGMRVGVDRNKYVIKSSVYLHIENYSAPLQVPDPHPPPP